MCSPQTWLTHSDRSLGAYFDRSGGDYLDRLAGDCIGRSGARSGSAGHFPFHRTRDESFQEIP